MATQKAALRSRRRLRIAAVLVLAALALAWSYRAPLRSQALTATALSARIACSCRYLGGRDLAQCGDELEPGTALVMLSEDREAKSVTARLPLLASQTATYRKGAGCVLEQWQD